MATRYWVGGAGTWNTSSTTNWSLSSALSLASASCSGTTLTTTGSPALVVGMTVWSSTNVSLGTISGGSGNTWTVTIGGTFASQTMTAATVGASVPTTVDDVIIDANSGTGTLSMSSAVCNDLTVTATQALTFGGSNSTISIHGNLSFPVSAGSFVAGTFAYTITFAGTGTGKTISMNGNAVNRVVFDGAGSVWTLASAYAASQTTLTNGTLDTSTNNYAMQLSTGNLTFGLGVGTKTLNLNGSAVTGTNWNVNTNATGFTFNPGTSTITLSMVVEPCTFSGGGQTYYDVIFLVAFTSGNSFITNISGDNTFRNLTIEALTLENGLHQATLSANQTITGTLTLGTSNTPVRRVFLQSNVLGTTRTITANAISSTDCDFRDITLAGTAAGASPTRAGDCGGNSGITFPVAKTVYWNPATAQAFDSASWTTSSGNTTLSINNFPLAQDTAVFDNNSRGGMNANNSGEWNIGTIDMSNRTTAFSWQFGNIGLKIYNNWSTGTGVTITSNVTVTFSGRNNTQIITSNGVAFSGSIIIDNLGGTVQLANAISLPQTLTVTRGIFNANGFNVTTGLFASSNSNTRTLTMGGGLWTLTGTGTVWNIAITTGLTFNIGTSNILLSNTSTTARTFTGGALTYNKITIGGTTGISATTFGANSTYDELASTKTVAHTITFNGSPAVITTWSVTGTAGNVVTVNSSVVGAQRTVTITNRTLDIDYLSVTDINSPNLDPVTFYAGANSTNGGNNTGVAFIARTTASPQNAHILTSGTTFTVPSDWNSSNNNIYMIGGGGGGGGAAVSGNNRAAGGGGGGGAYTRLTNFTATPSSSVTYAIGTSSANANGGNTTWDSGTYIANGGLKGTATTTPTSAGGAGGTAQTVSGIITAAFAGGNGGAGAFGTAASTGYGSGGGGGAGGPNGVGGNGGTGFGSSTAANVAGGGGGGNGGGSNGGNASSNLGGNGGNNFGGTGGGVGSVGGTGTAGTFGGGGAGSTAGSGGTGAQAGTGVDILNTIGGAGGRGGGGTGSSTTNTGLYGGGGSGGTVATSGGTNNAGAGSQGVIFIVYTPVTAGNFGFRLANTGILYVPTTSEFDEVTQSTISVKPTAFYAEEFDEVTNPGVPARYLNNGIVQTQSIIDEITGIS